MNKSDKKVTPLIEEKLIPKINPPKSAAVLPFDDGSKKKTIKQ
jgi:hypothetical protein